MENQGLLLKGGSGGDQAFRVSRGLEKGTALQSLDSRRWCFKMSITEHWSHARQCSEYRPVLNNRNTQALLLSLCAGEAEAAGDLTCPKSPS